jgi:antitoxin HicB
MNTKNKHVGSSFDDFLAEEGIKEEVEAAAIKKVIAFQIRKEMIRKHLTKTIMAQKMHTSRSAVERLFDPKNDSLTLVTLNKTAAALGKRLKVEFV